MIQQKIRIKGGPGGGIGRHKGLKIPRRQLRAGSSPALGTSIEDMKVLITGVAGFIGFHLAKECLVRGFTVTGVDSINDYYDPNLKYARLKELENFSKTNQKDFNFIKGDISDKRFVDKCFAENFERVFNLAAQAGVRKSLEDPDSYIQANVVGFLNILEGCRHSNVDHLIYASTSSVYGLNSKLPFSELEIADHPIQIYAATKRSNELMAHSYSHLFNLATTGLRFFTVYGPWGRPDMALFLFTKNILEDKKIDLFNEGNHTRDFTYVDDIVDGILLASENQPVSDQNWNDLQPDPSSSSAPFRVLNIGNGQRVELKDYIKAIENELGKQAKFNFLPIQEGDVADSLADLDKIKSLTGYQPKVSYKEGVKKFIEWYKHFYKVS